MKANAKITPEDFETLKEHLEAAAVRYPETEFKYKRNGLPFHRYRWDLVALSGFDIYRLYKYLSNGEVEFNLDKILGSKYE